MPLLDREQELVVLSEALAQAAAGCGSVVLVTGEAGIGKTSLIRGFLSAIGSAPRVLRCACEDLSVAEPLGPLRDLLASMPSTVNETILDTENLFAIFTQILSVCSDHQGGTVLVIEDLHWADDATVDFVRFVARRIVDHPLCLVVSARAEQKVGRQLVRRAFGDVPTEILSRIPLSPLSVKAVGLLCEGTNRDVTRVYQATGGNAFYVSELVKNAGEQLPLSIRDAVLARVDRVGPDARAIMETVSVIPRRAEIEHVSEVLPRDAEMHAGIQECLDAGLLMTDGESLCFAHELAREAVMSSLSELRKRDLNARLFQHLSGRKDVGLSRLLHHAQGAGQKDAVAELAPRAARAAAAMGSRKEAAAFFEIAIEAAGEASSPVLLEEAAWSSYLVGAHRHAANYQSRAMAHTKSSDDPIRHGEALRKLSRYRWVRSDTPGAYEAIHEAIAVLSEHRGPELAHAYSALSQLHMTSYRLDEVAEPANIAMELAREFDRPDILSHALNNLGMSYKLVDVERARTLLSDSVEIGRELEDPDHAARGLANWMHLEFENCEFERALHRAELSAAFSSERELGAYHRYSLGMIARAKHELGLWDEVLDPAIRGSDPDDRVPQSYNFNGGIALLNHQVRTGARIDEDLFAYLALYDHRDAEAQRIGPYSEIMAELAWLTGDGLENAIERLRMVADKTQQAETVGRVYVWLKRLGTPIIPEDLARMPLPFRLELIGDTAGAALEWANRNAPYQQAMTLAFGSKDDKQSALEIFQRLDAGPAITKLSDVEKASLPSRGRPRSAGPLGLTRRQLDVLALLGEGMSNTSIGEALFISPKTVDHHVSAILGKLEVQSRGEAAARARKMGLI